ncbi:MAG: hypothetical protein WBM09_09310, partial [Gallionella sp.]
MKNNAFGKFLKGIFWGVLSFITSWLSSRITKDKLGIRTGDQFPAIAIESAAPADDEIAGCRTGSSIRQSIVAKLFLKLLVGELNMREHTGERPVFEPVCEHCFPKVGQFV